MYTCRSFWTNDWIGQKSKFLLCMTDAFTKYAVVTTVPNKEAETVSQAIFKHWFCKFGLHAQIHTNGGKEFCNKLSDQLYLHLNIKQTTTSPAHPKLLKSISNPTFSLTLWIGNNLFQHSTFPTTPATTPPLRQLPLSYCLGLNWDYRHFQILTLNVYTMEKISHLNA